MSTWIRVTLRSMWHVAPLGDVGAAVAVADCLRVLPARTAEWHEGGRPARGRVCRQCWYRWDNRRRSTPARAARADWADRLDLWQAHIAKRSQEWARQHRQGMRDHALRYATRRKWLTVEWSPAREYREAWLDGLRQAALEAARGVKA